MSLIVSKWVWEHAKAEGAEMLVLLAIAEHASDQGACFPSMARIAKYARVTERGAQKAARALEAKGIITTDRNAGPKGCNRYRVNMVHPRTEFTPNIETKGGEHGNRGGEHGSTKPPNVVHPNRKEPSLEPSLTKGAKNKQDFDQEKALTYWRNMRRKKCAAYQDAPHWARKIIEAEDDP